MVREIRNRILGVPGVLLAMLLISQIQAGRWSLYGVGSQSVRQERLRRLWGSNQAQKKEGFTILYWLNKFS